MSGGGGVNGFGQYKAYPPSCSAGEFEALQASWSSSRLTGPPGASAGLLEFVVADSGGQHGGHGGPHGLRGRPRASAGLLGIPGIPLYVLWKPARLCGTPWLGVFLSRVTGRKRYHPHIYIFFLIK